MNYFAIRKLTASDLPGIDAAKFNGLKALLIKVNLEQVFFCLIAGGIWFISTLLIAGPRYFAISGTLLILVAYGFGIVRTIPLRRLEKELKIAERLRARKKGRIFAG